MIVGELSDFLISLLYALRSLTLRGKKNTKIWNIIKYWLVLIFVCKESLVFLFYKLTLVFLVYKLVLQDFVCGFFLVAFFICFYLHCI